MLLLPTNENRFCTPMSPTNADRLDHPSLPKSHYFWKFAGAAVLSIALLLMAKDNHHLRYRNELVYASSIHDISPSYSILPKKIYSVIGLESSGTQFVSKIIEDALKTGPYREGSMPCKETCTDDSYLCRNMKKISKKHHCLENSDVQVQHFSLPWGGTCHENPNPPIVDVVLPQQCTRDQDDPIEIEQCNAMATDIWGFQLNGKPMEYPIRYQLDITSHKKWYDDHGVEQFFVIVVRDDTISFAARHSHCNSTELRQQEEDVGTDLIVDAINAFMLPNEGEKMTSKEFTHWVAKQYQDNHGRRMLSALPSRDNVVVVSYESLVKLGVTYVKMLFNVLGIESDDIPDIHDSNKKYLNSTWL